MLNVKPRSLLDIKSLDKAEIIELINSAAAYKKQLQEKNVRKSLTDKVILTLFAENSTRTRCAFDMAALRLGANLLNWDEKTSSASKGESFEDTIRFLNAFGPDCMVIRHSEYNAPYYVSKMATCPVVNAGDSWRAHPTQALVDALTLIELKGRIEGLKVAICGDVAHSRVARCNIDLIQKLGGVVHLVTPSFLRPDMQETATLKLFENFDDGLKDCDVVMMLRIQKERMDASLIPDDITYHKNYGLTLARLKAARADVVVLHPGPMNRGVEIADEVADDPAISAIFRQADNRVPVCMAALNWAMNFS